MRSDRGAGKAGRAATNHLLSSRSPRHIQPSMPPFRKMLLLIVTLFFASLATHALWWVVRDELSTTWSRADWSSAKLLPRPADAPEAMVHVYAARTGRWRGIFAHHSWIVVKD